MNTVLKIRDLRVMFNGRAAVENLSISVAGKEIAAIVGESGSGKTVTALSVLGLVDPPGLVESGEIIFGGSDLLQLSESGMRRIRGKRISMVFQEPMTSLNPVMTIRAQIGELFAVHASGMSRDEVEDKMVSLLRRVELKDPVSVLNKFPHQLSGGMRQRVMIAMALALDPGLIIFDEPTTALDVTVQSQVISLIREIRKDTEAAFLFITHNLGVVRQLADYVYVMRRGNIVEKGLTREIIDSPAHPYTQALLASCPSLVRGAGRLPSMPSSDREYTLSDNDRLFEEKDLSNTHKVYLRGGERDYA